MAEYDIHKVLIKISLQLEEQKADNARQLEELKADNARQLEELKADNARLMDTIIKQQEVIESEAAEVRQLNKRLEELEDGKVTASLLADERTKQIVDEAVLQAKKKWEASSAAERNRMKAANEELRHHLESRVDSASNRGLLDKLIYCFERQNNGIKALIVIGAIVVCGGALYLVITNPGAAGAISNSDVIQNLPLQVMSIAGH
jgi:hypothetical protein